MNNPIPAHPSVATIIVQKAAQYRLWNMVIGYVLAFCLIGGGIYLTQRHIEISNIKTNSTNSEITAKLGQFEFVAKNTAPGIVLILCGTCIVITTIRRKSFARTQWKDENHPGLTEVNG